MIATNDRPVEVETFVWMRIVQDAQTKQKYYSVGQVKDVEHTLLVTLVGGKGGAVFFCTKHNEAFPYKHHCASCLNEVVDVADDASVTSCDTPEIERTLAGR